MPLQCAPTTLIVVDPTVADYQSLVSNVNSEAEIIVLNPDRDGVEQLTQILAERSQIKSIHILSHGEAGALQLGSTSLNTELLNRHRQLIQGWAKALAKQANILLYGCRVAAGERGRRFVQQLAQLTGAAIAASTTLTGSAVLCGNWELEIKTGRIHTPLAFRRAALESYPFVLATVLANQLYAVSLRADGNSDLQILNTTTGTATPVGTLAFGTFAIARDANTGRVYYIENTNSPNSRVAYFNPVTKTNTILGTTGVGIQFVKLAQATSGILYGLGTDTNLYSISQTTGAATNLGPITGGTPTAFSDASGDAAFDPNNPNRLIVLSADDANSTFYRLFAVDVTTRQATFIGNTGLNGKNSGSLAFGADGQLYATSTDAAGKPALYRLNPSTAQATLIAETSSGYNDFASLPTPGPTADLQVNAIGTATVSAGNTITYKVTVTNPSSTVDVPGVKVSDTVPAGITGVAWSGTSTKGGTFPTAADQTGSGNNLNTTINLPAGSGITYTITGTVSKSLPANTVLKNTATATIPDGFADLNPTNNTVVSNATITANTTGSGTPNLPPIATDATVTISKRKTAKVTGLSATDPDGTIASYTIVSVPAKGQGTLYLGNPGSGGKPIAARTKLTPAQVSQLYFKPSSKFTGARFAYTATDNGGAKAQKNATVTLAATRTTNGGNLPPVVTNAAVSIPNRKTTRLTGLSAADPDGTIASYTLLTVPANNQGTLYLKVPSGLKAVTSKTKLTPAQLNQLYFKPKSGFKGGSFSYTATDNLGASASTPGEVTLSAAGIQPVPVSSTSGCLPGINRKASPGNVKLIGTANADTLTAGRGNDTLKGLGCDDTLIGGRGKDLLNGGNGNDLIRAGSGRSTLLGGAGNDTLVGGKGNDKLVGYSGKDLLKAGAGNSSLYGRGGNDTLIGGSGKDLLNGGDGNDLIKAGSGDSTLKGGAGNDILIGGSGNDVIIGGAEADTLTGGTGRNRFVYKSINDGSDTITNFNVKTDVIDATLFIKGSQYSKPNHFKNYIKLVRSGSNTIVQADGNGDAAGGFKPFVTLLNVFPNALTAKNFLV